MAHCDTREASSVGETLTRFNHGDTIGRAVLGFFRSLRDAAARRREKARRDWLRHTTEAEIARLSPELRKDIGWPGRYER